MILSFLLSHASLIGEIAGDGFVIISAMSFIASVITGVTNTPDPKTTLGKAYRAVEFLGVVTERAKQTGLVPPANPAVQKGVDMIVGAVHEAIDKLGSTAPALLLVAGLALGLGAPAPGGMPVDQAGQTLQALAASAHQ